MKKSILLILSMAICTVSCANSIQDNQDEKENKAKEILYLQRISQHTAPCYKLYKTKNMWTFLEVETFTGRIWQVQYSVSDSSPLMKTVLSSENLAGGEEYEYAGRFELYPTDNTYNFILLDTGTGRTWQAQWSIDYEHRGILEIK